MSSDSSTSTSFKNEPAKFEQDSHMALEHGGYGETEDYDYDEALEDDIPDQPVRKSRVKPWIWVTAWVLVIATLLPYLYYALIPVQ